jgi:hypothetical protein
MSIQKYQQLSKDFETNEYLAEVLDEYERHFVHRLEEDEALIIAFNNVFSYLKKLKPLLKEHKSHRKKEIKSVLAQLERLKKEVKDIHKLRI